jgi:hypothetical protein
MPSRFAAKGCEDGLEQQRQSHAMGMDQELCWWHGHATNVLATKSPGTAMYSAARVSCKLLLDGSVKWCRMVRAGKSNLGSKTGEMPTVSVLLVALGRVPRFVRFDTNGIVGPPCDSPYDAIEERRKDSERKDGGPPHEQMQVRQFPLRGRGFLA